MLTYYEKLILVEAMEAKIKNAERMLNLAKKWKNEGIAIDSDKMIDIYESVIEKHNRIIEVLWEI